MPDWDVALEETTAHLRQLIRIDTVNPPGHERRAAVYLERVLRGSGIETQLVDTGPDRAALVGRLRGSSERGAVMLLAHMDVVGVEPARWSVDPFGGDVRDGYVYGRGAIDDKGMLAANLETMLLLKRHVVDAGHALARDVVFVATADEEGSGAHGIDWLAAHHPALLRAEYALNEGGRTRVVDGRPLYFAVQTAEKVPHVVRLTATGPGGHAAVPLADNAVLRLARALGAVGRHREPPRLTPVTRQFCEALAAVWPDADVRAALTDLTAADRARRRRGARGIARAPVLDAVLRSGVSPTRLAGGLADNVIPTEASAVLNVRTVPGESLDAVIARLARAIGDDRVTLTVVSRGHDAPASPVPSPMFDALAASVHALVPSLAVIPYVGAGATDSARLRQLGVHAYGVLPFPLDQDDEERMHAHDERIPLDALRFGVQAIHGAIARMTAAPGDA